MAGEENDAAGMGAVRERDAGVGGGGEGRRDAGNDFEGDAGGHEGLGFFAAAAEDERIAAFEPNDVFALPGKADEGGLDIGLRAAKAAAFFTDEDFFRIGPGEGEDGGGDEVIVDDGVGFADEAVSLEREQLGVAGAGADEGDAAG